MSKMHEFVHKYVKHIQCVMQLYFVTVCIDFMKHSDYFHLNLILGINVR